MSKTNLENGSVSLFPHPRPFSRGEKGGLPLSSGEGLRVREDF